MNSALKDAIAADDEGAVREIVARLPHVDASIDGVGNTALLKAAAAGNASIVRLLLCMSSNVNKANNNGFTPLMFAASGGHPEALQALLDAGANIEAISVNRYTALSWAAFSAKPECVEKLLNAGAELEVVSADGLRPLALSATNQKADSARLLVSRGADVDARGPLGDTPLFVARAAETLTTLLDAGANTMAVNNNGKDHASLKDTRGSALEPDLACALVIQSVCNGKPLWSTSPFGKPLLFQRLYTFCKTEGDKELLLLTVRKQAWLRRRHGVSLWSSAWDEP